MGIKAAAAVPALIQVLAEEDPENRQSVLRALGKLSEAIAVSRKAAALDPLNARAWSGLGSLLVSAGQFKEAHQALERALEVIPSIG